MSGCAGLTLAQAVEDPFLSDEISGTRWSVDTTGERDLYVRGFPYALTRAVALPICGEIGSLCAAEIISHFGARPEVELSKLLSASGRA